MVDGTGKALVGVVGEEDSVEAVGAVCAESGLVHSQSLEALLLGSLVGEDGLDGGKADGLLGGVLENVHFPGEAVLAGAVLETSGGAKPVVRVDKVVDESGDVGAVVAREIGSAALEQGGVGRRELGGGTGGLAGSADVAGEVVLQSGDDRAVTSAGQGTHGVGESETGGDVGVGHESNEGGGATGGETGDERGVELGLSVACEAHGSDGGCGDDGGGGDSTHDVCKVEGKVQVDGRGRGKGGGQGCER